MGKCENCGNESRMHVTDEKGISHELCNECNNQMVADYIGIVNFKDFTRKYIAVGVDGLEHEFDIDKEIFFMGIKWTACEIRNGEYEGYRFELYTDLEDDPFKSLEKLYAKIHKGLSVKYIEKRTNCGHEFYSLTEDRLTGNIEYDENSNGNIPRIIVDGKSYTWDEIGKILITYEGFNLHINIIEEGLDD